MKFHAVILLVLHLAAACVFAAAVPTTRPNFVLFIADDFTFSDCGPYGATDVRTPQLDRLARESMQFGRAFAASPTCSPSRSAIYSGLYPFRNGAHANHSLVRDDLKTLPREMKQLGYRVVLAGKTHIGPREVFPFEYLKGSNFMPEGKKGVLWTELSTAKIDELLADHDRKQPLCLIVASHSPHVFWPDNDGYDPARVTLPPGFIDTPRTREARCKYYTDVTWMDKQVGEVRDSLAKRGYADDTMFVFTADQGAQWPFAKWTLYEAGIRAPLLVHWPGKVKPASGTGAMVSLIDLMPTFIEAAGGKAPADLDGRSFLPVLSGASDRHRDEVFASHTGDREMNRTPMRCVRTERFKYILNLAPQIKYTTHISDAGEPGKRGYWDSWERLAETDPAAAAVITRYRVKPPEELYDLTVDPHELKNLAGDATYARTLEELREKVKQWRVQQGEDLSRVSMPEDGRSGEIRYAE